MANKKLPEGEQKESFGYRGDRELHEKARERAKKEGTTLSKKIDEFVAKYANNIKT